MSKKETQKQLDNLENVELAIYLGEEKTKSIPSKDSGYYYDLEKSSCTNGAYINWDSVSWSPVVKNVTTYPTRCDIHFTKTYTEGILNGADPVIKDELIPVTIDSDGTVKKANLETPWYSYADKNWANAIILKDESTASNYKEGSVIKEEAIESYFVWIPKYRYQLWDLGQYEGLTEIDTNKVHEIPIIFGDYNTSDEKIGECTTPMTSGATGNCQVGDYMTHPAFLSIPSTGFWVGKFETGYDGASSTSEAHQNIRDASKIIIKPNVYSWRSIQVANAFYTSYDYKRNLDSHMMKNTEWGAVAYLQHSKYGSTTSVRINNNSTYLTGYAANNEPTCGNTLGIIEECNKWCNDGSCNSSYPNSVLASTTGNINGVFDLSGGAWEYTMGVMLDQNGQPMSGRNSIYNSGFNGTFGCPTCDSDTSGLTALTGGYNLPDKKYYDMYIYSFLNTNQYQMRILGDATGEMGPFSTKLNISVNRQISSWYSDEGWSLDISNPWYHRGGYCTSGDGTGIFAAGGEPGRKNAGVGFRIILN